MFDTNDVYNDAVKGSSLHAEKQLKANGQSQIGLNILGAVLLMGTLYIGYYFYELKIATNHSIVIENELVAKIQMESEVHVGTEASTSEEEYLRALRDMESELSEESKEVNVAASEHMDLSSAMNNLITDTQFFDPEKTSNYTQELRKEIADKMSDIDFSTAKEERKVVVKKGDTLQAISNRFYGDAMNYKRIIASNDSLIENEVIYVGQTINLPY